MAERRFDRDALRKEQRLTREQSLWQAFTALVLRHGSKSPVEDTRILFAGLHGLAVLTLGGRANLGDAERSGEALARESARRLVAAILLPRASGHRT
ncbi:hypothetical protein F0U60_36475 [Archangium minus]|uniref:Tetracyclin repressor-like C-terminal domain-containing protein n=1 Tax=Archangium minus TaxID=83450 RepID=A0ABY9X0T0_9BACT|nr:hypothetical protein F0U60_36475 [Archangium minus]